MQYLYSKRFFVPLLLGILLIFAVQPAKSQESNLQAYMPGEFTVEKSPNKDLASTFIINATLIVSNLNGVNVTFQHSDTCLFKLDVAYKGDTTGESTYPYGCGDAIVGQDFKPGDTTSWAVGAIKFNDPTLSDLPDGEYALSLQLLNWQTGISASGLNFRVSGGKTQLLDTNSHLNSASILAVLPILTSLVLLKQKKLVT